MILNFIVTTDWWFENLLLHLRTPFLVQVFESVTFFGNPLTITVLAGIIALFLLASPRFRPYLKGYIVTLSGAALSGYALKEIIRRARPDGLIPALAQPGFSFPSGHATASMVLYGFLAFLLCREYPHRRKLVVLITLITILIIGFSRLYLGVHFPSDVIGGYALGGLWLLIGMRVTGTLNRRSCT